jgi:hypothetical protein
MSSKKENEMGKTNGHDSTNSDNGTNGGNGSEAAQTSLRLPKPPSGYSAVADGRPLEELIPIEIGLFRRGYEAGRNSGRSAPDADTEAALTQFAGESAQRLAAAPFRPEENISDAQGHREYERILDEMDKVKDQEANARAEVCECEKALAAVEPEPTPPRSPVFVGMLGVLGISATLTFSLRDIFFTRLFPDPVQGLFVAWLFGALIASLVTWTILSGAAHEGAEKRHWVGLIIAFAFGLAILLLRLASVRGSGESMMAWGLAVLEIVAVVAVDCYAAGLRRQWASYRSRLPAYCSAARSLADARARLDGRLQAIGGLEARARQFRNEVRMRESLVRSTKAVRAAAERAIVVGYRLAIEHNRGRLRGAAQQTLTDAEIAARVEQGRSEALFGTGDGHEPDA